MMMIMIKVLGNYKGLKYCFEKVYRNSRQDTEIFKSVVENKLINQYSS